MKKQFKKIFVIRNNISIRSHRVHCDLRATKLPFFRKLINCALCCGIVFFFLWLLFVDRDILTGLFHSYLKNGLVVGGWLWRKMNETKEDRTIEKNTWLPVLCSNAYIYAEERIYCWHAKGRSLCFLSRSDAGPMAFYLQDVNICGYIFYVGKKSLSSWERSGKGKHSAFAW